MSRAASLYIHIPFCLGRCYYCAFYSTKADDPVKAEKFRVALQYEIQQTAAMGRMADRIDTVYFGGGNPCFDGGRTIAAVLAMPCIKSRIDSATEVTAECNPESADLHTLQQLRLNGVNRMSMGLQSTDNELLAAIGRRHTYEGFLTALSNARKAGFCNISADLIYGLPGQSLRGWENDLERAISLQLEHLSCYALKIEEESKLHEMICCGQLPMPDDDLQADMFERASEMLRSNGYDHYEISNFARHEMTSKHNLVYWQGGDYLGFGPSAHSRIGRCRFWNESSLDAYIAASGISDIQHKLNLNMSDWIMETAMMMLRTSQGIDNEIFSKFFGVRPFSVMNIKIKEFINEGLIFVDNRGMRLNERGFLLSNRILAEILTFSYNLDS